MYHGLARNIAYHIDGTPCPDGDPLNGSSVHLACPRHAFAKMASGAAS